VQSSSPVRRGFEWCEMEVWGMRQAKMSAKDAEHHTCCAGRYLRFKPTAHHAEQTELARSTMQELLLNDVIINI